jgi:hypothetical protein
MTRYGVRHAASATGLTFPSRGAGQAPCGQAEPDAWFPEKGSARPGQGRQPDLRALRGPRPVPGLRTVRHGHLGRNRDRHLGRHHTTGTRLAVAPAQSAGGMRWQPCCPQCRSRRGHALRSRLRLKPEQEADQ